MAKRKICIVTGTRAEYGLLYWLLKEIQNDTDLELQLIATGMHLSKDFGSTFEVIERDGFIINSKIDMSLGDDSARGVTRSLGLGVIGFGEAFEELRPDIIVVLGDRYELLAAAQAALIAKIPLAHIHGGEKTEGAFDEAIRHSITKMAHLHFVAHDEYKSRVIQLGENPKTVFNVGAIGLDHLSRSKFLTLEELEGSLEFKLGKLNFLVTYHPATLAQTQTSQAMDELLSALGHFPEARIIFTKSNSDTDGKMIGQKIDLYASENKDRVASYTSLGQQRYLSLLKYIDVVIGNSSSGLLEAPAFEKPTVNIGPRQKGRLKASSVVDSEIDSASIVMAIKKALSLEFRESFVGKEKPYKNQNASLQIKEVLKGVEFDGLVMKSFYDLEPR